MLYVILSVWWSFCGRRRAAVAFILSVALIVTIARAVAVVIALAVALAVVVVRST